MGLNIEDKIKLQEITSTSLFNTKLDQQKLDEAILLVEKTNSLEEIQLILNAYQNSAKNTNLRNAITAQTIRLLTLELRKTQEITEVVWNIISDKYAHILDTKKTREAWILKISEEQKSLELFKKLLKEQIDKLKDTPSTELLEIIAEEVCENPVSSKKTISRKQNTIKFKLFNNLLKILHGIDSKKIFKRNQIQDELKEPLLQYIENELEDQDISTNKKARLSGIKQKIKKIFSKKTLPKDSDLKLSAQSVSEIVSPDITNEEFARQMKEIADAETNQRMQQLHKELDEMHAKVMEIFENKEEVYCGDIVDKSEKQDKSKKHNKLIGNAKRNIKKIINSIQLFRKKEQQDLQFMRKDTEYLRDQYDTLIQPANIKPSGRYFDSLKSMFKNILKNKTLSKSLDYNYAHENYTSDFLMSGRINPVINEKKKNQNFMRLLKKKIDKSMKNGTEFYNKQLRKLNKIKKVLSKAGRYSYSGLNKTIKSAEKKLKLLKIFYKKIYEYGSLLTNKINNLSQVRTSFGVKNNLSNNSKSLLNSNGKFFKPKRCKDFFTTGEGSRFFKENNIQYQHTYNRVISKLQPSDVIGKIKNGNVNIAEFRGNKLLLSEVNQSNKHLQDDLLVMVLRNISDPINPPIVNLEGKVNLDLLINLCKAKDAPHVFFKIDNIKSELSDEFLTTIKLHNNKFTEQKFLSSLRDTNETDEMSLNKYPDHQLNFSRKLTDVNRNSDDLYHTYSHRNKF